ncbi:M50 family metallopeptidase [Pectobacterium versatile]|uniref:M50 family metallopeptidase n=1 Tax=Pectobacterium versatile TaxID=2488639 RepID=UPI001F36D3B2|nr:M50 family metallopeptidase [Pectobacterium versatile]
MELPKITMQQQKERILNHELGHWLAATHFGFHIDHLAIEGDRVGIKSGYVNMYPRPTIDKISSVEDYLMSRIVILCAGAVMDDGWYNDLHPLNDDQRSTLFNCGLIDKTGLSDYAKIQEHLPLLSAIRFGVPSSKAEEDKNFKSILDQAWQYAYNILQPKCEVLDEMLKAMLKKSEGQNNYRFTKQEMKSLEANAMQSKTRYESIIPKI